MSKIADMAEPNGDFDQLRDLIISRRDAMPKRLAQVAAFVITEPDEVALGTAASIAVQIGVQPSTLVRFAQALGYKGFSGLQAVCRRKLQRRWPDYQERLSSLPSGPGADHATALFDGFSEANIRSILRLREQWNPASFAAAAEALARATTIHIVGNRRSFPAAAYLGYMFGRLGLKHHLHTGLGDMDDQSMAAATTADALIAISFTPYTPKTVALAALAARNGIPVVSITDSALSPLAALASQWLEVVEEDYSGFRALGATLCLCTALATHAAELRLNKSAASPK